MIGDEFRRSLARAIDPVLLTGIAIGGIETRQQNVSKYIQLNLLDFTPTTNCCHFLTVELDNQNFDLRITTSTLSHCDGWQTADQLQFILQKLKVELNEFRWSVHQTMFGSVTETSRISSICLTKYPLIFRTRRQITAMNLLLGDKKLFTEHIFQWIDWVQIYGHQVTVIGRPKLS